MATERLGNLGYLMMGKETTKGTPVIPSIAFPLYKESLNTSLNHDEDNPIVGLRVMPYAMFMGQRNHEGSFTVLGEPNTAQYIFDMLLQQSSVTGANPYTHPFVVGDAKSYTVDPRVAQRAVMPVGLVRGQGRLPRPAPRRTPCTGSVVALPHIGCVPAELPNSIADGPVLRASRSAGL